jgi:hypothetical protein
MKEKINVFDYSEQIMKALSRGMNSSDDPNCSQQRSDDLPDLSRIFVGRKRKKDISRALLV